MKTFRNGEVWLKGFEADGIRMVPAAVGMNSIEYKGRPACIYDGWCHVGCPIGALANPLVTYLADARKAGAEVRALSTVTRVLTDAAGKKATGVEYYDRDGEKQVQQASVVVLAAWAAQNPRLMLNSATDKHPKGLANSSGLVGKYMMTHFTSGTSAMFDEDVEQPQAPSAASTCPTTATTRPPTRARSARPSSSPARRQGQRPGRLRQRAARPVRPGLADFMKRAASGFARITAFGEEMPNIENRVELVERQGRVRHAARPHRPQL